jgi:chromosomal replication initiator protein
MPDAKAQWVWEAALGQLQLQVSRPSYNTWLKDTVGLAIDATHLVVGLSNTFAAECLEQRMYGLVQSAVEGVVGAPLEVHFRVVPRAIETAPSLGSWPSTSSSSLSFPGPPPEATMLSPSREIRQASPALNPRYTFEQFVVGKGNQLAYAAAVAVSSSPGIGYNPLFVYSGVGLGKTHLLHGTAHQISRLGLNFLYVTTEQFTNEFIAAIRDRSTDEFRARYRSVDVLLIDDIQFISGKEQTQEGFFHTFNDLHNANRQIIVASDRPPKALALLEDRLRSRFEWGLIADIQPPDLETRTAILRFKAEQANLPISNEVLDFIARKAQKNIRELEGSLNRVVAYAQLVNSTITIDLAAHALADLLHERHLRTLQPEILLEKVAAYYHLQPGALTGKRRDKQTALARQVAMYLLREDAHRPLKEVGRLLGGRDHTTVIYAVRKVSEEMESSNHLRQDILTLREELLTTKPQR